MKHICVIGLGYIGLPTAVTFASYGVKVTGVDINQHAVDVINSGKAHIIEPDLDVLITQTINAKLLTARTTPVEADCYIIAVPTPFKENHEPDLTYVESAARSIAPYLKHGNLIILESTSPVGTTERISEILSTIRKDLKFPKIGSNEQEDIFISYCPERVLPGNILHELVHNDRIIGGITPRSSELASSLYKKFVQGACLTTDSRTAELCKLTENSFRDVNIAFANELSIICDDLNINVWNLISLANRHPRVNILNPGPGVGGHCIAVDPWFIITRNPDITHLMRTARKVNDYKPQWVIDKIKLEITDFLSLNSEKKMKDLTIACYGLAFKPDIDDLRESPALKIVETLANSGINVLAVEPNVLELPKSLDKAKLVSIEEAASADISVILVAHKQFKSLPKNGQRWIKCVQV